MLVKILDADDELVSLLKAKTGCSTASKAFLCASTAYLGFLDSSRRDRDKINSLERELSALRNVVEGARSAAALLLDRTGQTELQV